MAGFKLKYILLIFIFLLIGNISLAEEPAPDPEHSNGHPNGRMFFVAPIGGAIYHKLPSMNPRMPSQADWGPSFGIFSAFISNSITLITFPYYATANNATVYGDVTHFDYYFNWKERFQPLVGGGFDITKIDVKGTSRGDTLVVAPWPKVGMRFKLSRYFSVTPYVAYLYQYVDITNSLRHYHSGVFGAHLRFQLNRRFMAKLKYYYRYTHDGRNGHDIKLRLHFMASRRLGIMTRFQYSKQVFDEFISILGGPAIIF